MSLQPEKNETESAMAWDDLRTSPAFPAIVGGIAGAVGGIALMFLFSRLNKPKESLPAAYDSNGNPMNIVYLPAPKQPRLLGFTMGDLMALATLGIGLYRQIQSMQRIDSLEAESKQEGPRGAAPAPIVLPQTPAAKPSPKP